MLTLRCLELVYGNKYFYPEKILVYSLFRIMADHTEDFGLKQKSVIKFLLAKKYKPCEICKRMCEVLLKRIFLSNKVYK